jgi:carboxylesterase
VNTLVWFIVVGSAWAVVRAIIARRKERAFEAANPRGPDGYIIGAEPLALDGKRRGAVLLLHGYNDSPQSMYSIAADLHAHGWTVRVPVLPGHARTLPAFGGSGSAEWIGAAREELAALRATGEPVAVGGLSMGGAIALLLAAEDPGVRAVVLFAPFLHASPTLRVLSALSWLVSLGARYIAGGGERSVHDPVAGARMIAYRCGPPRLLVQLRQVVEAARAVLPAVRQPVLYLQSREDNRIPVPAAEAAFALIGSMDKTLRLTIGNGHVLTVDFGHEELERVVADWLESRLR